MPGGSGRHAKWLHFLLHSGNYDSRHNLSPTENTPLKSNFLDLKVRRLSLETTSLSENLNLAPLTPPDGTPTHGQLEYGGSPSDSRVMETTGHLGRSEDSVLQE